MILVMPNGFSHMIAPINHAGSSGSMETRGAYGVFLDP